MYDWGNSKFQIYDFNEFSEFEDLNQTGLVVDSDDIIWMASLKSGLIKYYRNENSIVSVNKNINTSIPSELHSLSIIGDTLLIGGNKSFGIYELKTNNYKHIRFPQNIRKQHPNMLASKIAVDDKKRMWIGTEYGLLLYDSNFNFLDLFRTDSHKNSISDNSVTDIHQDENGEIWISTYNGLNKVSESNEAISFIHIKAGESSGIQNIPSNKVSCINEYEDNVFFGSQNGIFYYDKITTSS